MHTVVQTPAFLSAAKAEGMTEEEQAAAVDQIAKDPAGGAMIVGSGGCRKVRVAGKGKGKSGGYRVVTYYCDVETPVFLIAVLAKGTRENFSDAEVKAMAKLTKVLADGLKRPVPK